MNPRTLESRTKKVKILIVDDEPNICRSCIKILSKKSKYQVHYSLNGYDALKMMETEIFDVVVTDLKMSALGGMEVLRRIKEDYPDTRVIVITGYATVSSSVEVMKLGAFDYLPKPFTPHELRAVVEQALLEKSVHLTARYMVLLLFTVLSVSNQEAETSYQFVWEQPATSGGVNV
ncbi:response regulator [Desulfobacterales bacterium HSG16]|nr:response regulator [Desulfobacterales bacterium HSG16]